MRHFQALDIDRNWINSKYNFLKAKYYEIIHFETDYSGIIFLDYLDINFSPYRSIG